MTAFGAGLPAPKAAAERFALRVARVSFQQLERRRPAFRSRAAAEIELETSAMADQYEKIGRYGMAEN
jgi:hypothetical protein